MINLLCEKKKKKKKRKKKAKNPRSQQVGIVRPLDRGFFKISRIVLPHGIFDRAVDLSRQCSWDYRKVKQAPQKSLPQAGFSEFVGAVVLREFFPVFLLRARKEVLFFCIIHGTDESPDMTTAPVVNVYSSRLDQLAE
jgi:hypothetical protein